MSRILLLPAALALALYAGCAAFEATRLPHTGAWTLFLTAGVLAAAAAGLVARQLWAYVFAVLVLGSTTLAYVVLAAFIGRESLTGGHDDWAGVRSVVLGGVGLVVLAVAVVSFVAVLTLGLGRRAVAAAGSPAASVLSAIVALCAIALLGWLVGYRYWHLQLRAQNQCLSGAPGACRALAGEARLFTKEERIGFARRGCEAGGNGSCEALASFLGPEHPEGSAEARALAARCQADQPQVCQRLGVHLLTIGDRSNGARYLVQACDVRLEWCSSAAKQARERGAADLSRQLLEKGCEREDARSCTALLRQVGASLPPGELRRLELRACLVGDVNDCRALMQRDLGSVCALVCQGTTESRMHTCRYCAQDAEAAGERALAEAWHATNCQHGYRWSCSELERLRKGGPPSGPSVEVPSLRVRPSRPALPNRP